MIQNIGQMIFSLREESGILQKNLARGISNVSELSRIEWGGKETDKMLLEALFQRLGKSMDKLEIALSNEEYRMVFLRTLILKNMMDKNCETVDILLDEYSGYSNARKPLHQQYLLSMRAMNRYIIHKDTEECSRMLGEALDITFQEWRQENWQELYLCTQEIEILLMKCYLMIESDHVIKAEKVLEKLNRYIEGHFTDGEEKVRTYPQCAWLLGKVYLTQGKAGLAYDICESGKECLVQNGVLTVMDELLELELVCLNALEKEEKQCFVRKQKEAVEFLYCITEYRVPEDKILYVMLKNQQNEFVISNELVRELRLARNMSQEALCEDICTQETLSRIETGRRSPNKNKLHEMLQRLELERGTYYGYVLTDDYGVYEKVRLFKRNWFQGNEEAAVKLLDEIEKELDLTVVLNRQFVENSRLIVKIANGEVGAEEAIGELWKFLRYTMKEFDGNVRRIPFRGECVILNQLAICMKKAGQEENAILLYEQILNKYEHSKVLEQHHAVSKLLLYVNYSMFLEENEELEKAESYGKRGINLASECERGDVTGILLANLACVYEKRNLPEEEKLCRLCFENSFYLLNLYGHQKNSKVVEKYYEKKYNSKLIN